MENQLSKKQKRIILLVGVTGAVYLSFKYLLPLVVPFLIAYLLALGIRPIARWMHKKFHIKESIGAVMVIVALVVLLAFIVLLIGNQLLIQLANFMKHLPEYMESLRLGMGDFCSKLERNFSLEEGLLKKHLYDMNLSLMESVKVKAMPYIVGKSLPIFKGFMEVFAVVIVTITAVLLTVKDLDHFRKMKERSSFRMELTLVGRRLSIVGGAYLKTQGTILSLTVGICMIGLMLMGNQYSVLLGVLIGLLDAMPIFGTGTVLIPWALMSVISGNVFQAVVLVAMYLISYFTRELLEAKLMGKSMGITALESLMAMFIGLQLFGIVGFILGPVGFLVIRELVNMYS